MNKFHSFFKHHPLGSSLGTKLLIYVLGISLLTLGSLAWLAYRALEQSAQAEIQGKLMTQSRVIEGKLQQTEAYVTALVNSVKVMQSAKVNDLSTYRNLAFEFFQERPDLTMSVYFGQAPFQLVRDRQWFFPYFYQDQGQAIVGQLLPDPHQHIRYSELFQDDDYPSKDYYKTPTETGQSLWLPPFDWYGITMTSFLQPVYDNRSLLLGMAGADVNVTALSQALNTSVIRGQGYFVILSEQGNLLAYPPEPIKAKQRQNYQQVRSLKTVWEQAQNKDRGLIQVEGSFWAYQRIKSTNWLMLATVPQATVLKPILFYTAASAIGTGSILFLMVWLFVRRLNQRLHPILNECRQLKELDEQRMADWQDDLAALADQSSESCSDNLIPGQSISAIPPIEIAHASSDELEILAATVRQTSAQLQRSIALLEQSHEQLEERVRERTEELTKTLHHLQQTQAQLIQTEKMSSLGQMVAGIAHEVNNPTNFIHGNLKYAMEYVQALIETLKLYQHAYPDPPVAIQVQTQKIELDFILADLPKLLLSMQEGTQRIQEIVHSMRGFSRLDGADKQPTNLHNGIESTLLILGHRLCAKGKLGDIRVVKDYGNLPLVECYAGQFNQVLTNILVNAIDALEETWIQGKNTVPTPEIVIRTELFQDQAIVRIADNGAGMTEAVRAKLFAPFFTTKPSGKGTGLGLSISYQIITDNHQGALTCTSIPGQGTEFKIALPIRHQVSDALPRVSLDSCPDSLQVEGDVVGHTRS